MLMVEWSSTISERLRESNLGRAGFIIDSLVERCWHENPMAEEYARAFIETSTRLIYIARSTAIEA